MKGRGVSVPTLVGGAALTRHYAESDLRRTYGGALYYGKDAFEALSIMDKVMAGEAGELDAAITERLAKRAETEAKIAASKAKGGGGAAVATEAKPARSAVARDVAAPEPPFWGDRLVEEVPLEAVYSYVNKVALYRGQWGFKKGRMGDEAYARFVEEEVEAVFRRLCERCKAEGILKPRVVYGYWPANSEGEDLIVYDPAAPDREVERFSFPRQAGKKRLCISDFFRPVDSGEKDVVALTCVTMGEEASRRARELFEANEYTEYLYLHGFGVECAEALAELWHKRVRQELGIDGEDAAEVRKLFTQHYRGSRYSFGYPACPDLSDEEVLFRLLRPERIGCRLTENWQIDPEQSTSALIVHHPEAKYFNV